MNHSHLESFENAVEDMHPTLQAVATFAFGAVFWVSVFWAGSTLSALARGLL